jgi:uncharacterized protein YyaL (SSP411 family)
LTKPNRLIHETSPYLLQHAHNPVDWYPWGDMAFAKARADDKPILLSIGYSSCHWCHVMAHESFEDESTAQLMNENFINIKVDREERPDIDTIYMRAVVSMIGRGGWPLTAFLTAEGEPFFGGTYFPSEDRHGLPSFRKVLRSVSKTYRDRRDEIQQSAESVVAHIAQQDLPPAVTHTQLSLSTLDQAVRTLSQQYDPTHGGFGSAPKFPQAMTLDFLLREYHRSGNSHALRMVERSLQKMARGGIYDQLGGGFHRYSVDERWLVPHFEKMLYDNALLSRVYLWAYQVTGNSLYLRIAEETLDYVQREMTSPEGGFYSAQDADSEGEEGKFFLWTPEQVIGVLGKEQGGLFNEYFAVTEQGNFEGKNVLSVPRDLDVVAHLAGVPVDRLEDIIVRGRRDLFVARERRLRPGRDEKVITSWNGLMLASFADAARILDRDEYRLTAERNAGFILRELRHDGQLLHLHKDSKSKQRGYLEDYAAFSDALLALYEATFDDTWFREAKGMADEMVSRFKDPSGAGFYDTDGHESLITRPRTWEDGATPSGNSLAARVLLRLAALTGDTAYEDMGEEILRAIAGPAARHPSSFGHLLSVLNFALSPPEEIAIIGDPTGQDTIELLGVVHGHYRPSKVVALGVPTDDSRAVIPLLAGKSQLDGKATAYVCRRFACERPVTTPTELAMQLRSGAHERSPI